MLDILLWVLFLTVVEGGSISLTRWLWKMADEACSDGVEGLYVTASIFAFILAAAVGIMLAASAVLGTMRLFGIYA